jgi:hypothetical protein
MEGVLWKTKIDGPNGACDDENFNWKTESRKSQVYPSGNYTGDCTVNAEKYLKSTEELVNIQSVKRLGSIEVRNKKQEWFRSHPEMFAEISIIRRESTGDFYAVDPQLVHELEEETRGAYITAAISYEGALFLWPIIKPKADGSGIQLFENDLADLSLSQECWIRRQWMSGSKSYKVDQANTDRPPEWPDNTSIGDWVKRGFRGRFIDTLDHQLVRQLRGDL